MVSMRDISIKCGVSVATVSKALNNQNDIGESTREYIKETAKAMGYFPNSSARALKTNRTYNIGVLLVDEAQSGLTHAYFSEMLDSFMVTAEKNGYDITFISSRKSYKEMTYLEHCKYRGVDGVILACVDFENPEIIELVRSELPLVTIDYRFNDRTAILSDNIKGIKDLITYIYEMGHSKIAYIHGADSAVTRNRVGSFYQTLESFGIMIPDEYVKEGVYVNAQIAAELTKELLDLEDRPTCIIYPDDFSCIGGINAIKERGLKIPEDISVVGYDGTKLSQALDPKLTTLKQDTESIGVIAAEKLVKLIEKPKIALVESIVVEGKLISGESVGKITTSN